ncbi:hypothetical protein CJ030_MR8G026870 [Morella rubra]|uniref:RNase H type-1 domain-containing protein n=1 Tax=Morella rubra TaxID=262757 RepID=A0A6A1UT14_9ROSI|nr:hypothetical protein CJ030_MR8G026870 [Morella rubra]
MSSMLGMGGLFLSLLEGALFLDIATGSTIVEWWYMAHPSNSPMILAAMFCRNKFVHDGKLLDVTALSRSVNKLGREHLDAWNLRQYPGKLVWVPPPPDTVKVNTDVAIRENFAVAAAVFRGSQGIVLGATAEKILVGSPVEGEAVVAKMGIMEASHRGWPRVVLECDSSLVIKFILQYPKCAD